jgi:hypothetical protein
MNGNEGNVSRLIKLATLLFGVLAGGVVYLTLEPNVDAAQRTLDDDEAMLRSDEVAFSTLPGLRLKRDVLAKQYAGLFNRNAEAVFLGELGALTRLHRVSIVSASLSEGAKAAPGAPGKTFGQTSMQLELHGRYRDLLAAVSDLSRGTALVDVGLPSLRRDGRALLATIPLQIDEPAKDKGQP